ncbi:MAG: hypothetical protein ACI9TY_000561 [Alphaproteobacteria bacterium]|jgi:uncharacterized protein (DUF1499 family)
MKKFIIFSCLCVLTACSGVKPQDLTVDTPCPPSPNCVSSLTQDIDKKVEPFILRQNLNSWSKLTSYLRDNPKALVVFSDDTVLQLEFRTKWLHFVDDVVLRRDGNYVDIRSASRVGYSDLGMNRRRVEALRINLRRQLIIK